MCLCQKTASRHIIESRETRCLHWYKVIVLSTTLKRTWLELFWCPFIFPQHATSNGMFALPANVNEINSAVCGNLSREVKVLPVEDALMILGLLRILLESCSPKNIVYYIHTSPIPAFCVCLVWVKKRKEGKSCGERGVVTETGRGDLPALSKHQATGHTLRLFMELQTTVCFHILVYVTGFGPFYLLTYASLPLGRDHSLVLRSLACTQYLSVCFAKRLVCCVTVQFVRFSKCYFRL